MTLGPRTRKAMLTAHVASSVGWLGGVAAVIALALAGLVSEDADTRRAAYLATELIAWAALLPMAAASFATGVVQSLGTRWGLLRHYWVVFKLGISVVASVVLIAYTQTLATFAEAAARSSWTPAELRILDSPSLLLHSCIAAILLTVATALAVFKPAGLTARGHRLSSRR
jgi:hypothetical protein